MGDFSADWLTLREPVDRAARSTRLTRSFVAALGPAAELQIVDLGAGTGANLRYLADWLPPAQRWRLADRDPHLLALARDRAAVPVETIATDLARLDDPAVLAGCSAVTASALLDLVSAPWLATLATRCAHRRAAVLFALTYDGRIAFTPWEEGDEDVRALVNIHQRTDKGFGPALGAEASSWACQVFAAQGYQVERDRSDWQLGPRENALQRELIEGWARAVSELRSDRTAEIAAWRDRRLAHVQAGQSYIVVGHEDVAGWLP